MRDLTNNINLWNQFNLQEGGNVEAVASQWVDLQGYDSCTFIFQWGTLADAGGASFTPKIEFSVDGVADSGDVPDADLLPTGTGQEAAAAADETDDDTVTQIGYIGKERFVRAALVIAGNSAAADIGCVAVLGHPAVAPAPSTGAPATSK